MNCLSFTCRLDTSTGGDSEPDNDIHPAVMSGDMGRVVKLQQERQLTAHEKYHALTKHFVPGPSCMFSSIPCGKQQCSFQRTWLTKYSGLVYSEEEGGGYCKYCVLFGQAPYSMLNFKATLVTLPLTNLKKPLKNGVNTFMALVVTHHVSTIYKQLKKLSPLRV